MEDLTTDSVVESGTQYYFDLLTGQLLVGEASFSAHVEAGCNPADIRKLEDILHDQHHPIAPGTYSALDTKDWDIDDHDANGHWLSNLPRKAEQAQLDRFMLNQASRLGISPGVEQIKARYGRKLSNFYDAIQVTKARRIGRYAQWSHVDAVNYVAWVKESGVHETIREGVSDCAASDTGPSPAIIRKRFTSISNLLESAGYLTKQAIAKWSEQDYIYWGVRYMFANDGQVPTLKGIYQLSTRRRGPSQKPIYKYFDSVKNYQGLVRAEYEIELESRASTRERILHRIEKGLEDKSFPQQLVAEAESEDELLALAARYQVVNSLLPNISEDSKRNKARFIRPDSFVRAIQKADCTIKPGQIEQAALTLDVFDYIWPMDEYLEILKVA